MKLDQPTIDQIRNLFRDFEKELDNSNYSMNSKAMRANYARRFVDWLADEYDPGKYDGSYRFR